MVNVIDQLSDALFDVYEMEQDNPIGAEARLHAVYHTLRLYYGVPEDELRETLRELDAQYQKAHIELEVL